VTEVYPNYYPSFSCVGGSCRHNCCIGWEIDVNEEALRRYEAVEGELGARLCREIVRDGTPHFRLGEGERCPFLNSRNLCDLILELGEESLCEICAEHPRFRNYLPDRVEIGLGLCCEAAGRLILGQRELAVLISREEPPQGDEILALRDRAVALLQDRSAPILERLERLDRFCGNNDKPFCLAEYCSFLLSLERLDEAWTRLLLRVRAGEASADSEAFRVYMADRETEFEQFAVYLAYRHLAPAWDEAEFCARAAFVSNGTRLLYWAATVLFTQNGSFSFADMVELARLFSSELEYSEENAERLVERELRF